MKIELEPYEHTCGDGCCYQTGYDVFIDGKKIDFTTSEDAQELVDILNEYFKDKKKWL